MDQSDVQMWVETFFKSQEPQWVLARGGVMTLLAAVLTLFTWMTGKVGWWGLKLTGRGARACWPGQPADPLAAELTQEFLSALESHGCKDKPLTKMIGIGTGCVDLATKEAFLGAESLRPLLSRRQHKKLVKAAQRVYDRLSAKEARLHKLDLLEQIRPHQPQPPEAKPVTLQQTRDDEIHSLFVNVFGENGP